MKTILLIFCSLGLAFNYFSQFNTGWSTNLSNSASNGFVGIGVKATAAATTQAQFNFQLHGVANYTTPNTSQNGGNNSINYGNTFRLGMTNSTTGNTWSDGTLFMMAGNDFHLINREQGQLHIGVGILS